MAFGESSFGDNSARPSQRGRGRGGMGGGGGNNRNRNRRNNRGGGGGGGNGNSAEPPTPAGPINGFDTGDVGSGDPFDNAVTPPGFDATFGGSGSIFEDPDSSGGESWRTNAWGMLNQAGISQDSAFGGQQAEWLDGQLQDWYDQWQGRGAMAGDDASTWIDAVAGIPGTAAPAGGMTLDYLRNQWGPEMQRYLTARYQAQTPRGRGTDTTRWSGPRRVIQF